MDQKIKLLVILIIIVFVFGLSINRYTTDLSALENINIKVENASIQELKLKYCKLKLNVVISNPTSEHISELSAEFDITIVNTYVGNGSIPTVSIPAKSQIRKDVILTIYYADVGNAVIEGIQTGNFDLAIYGKAKGNIFFNLLTVSRSINASYSFS